MLGIISQRQWTKQDIALDVDKPYVIVCPRSWERLKTKGSDRKLPSDVGSKQADNLTLAAS